MNKGLGYVYNVRDFGAVGDGVANDWRPIMAALNWRTGDGYPYSYRGTVYFPPGTYYVSQPIDFSAADNFSSGAYVLFRGEMGRSIVTGNFVDYVFRRYVPLASARAGVHGIEKLTIINQAAGGGGIRLGFSQGYAIRDCDITADIAINDDNSDNIANDGTFNGSFEGIIENCNCRSTNARSTGSAGLFKTSDGPVSNCTFTGFDIGMGTSTGEGAAAIQGCYFEANNIGFQGGHAANPSSTGGGYATLAGNYFKNNGIAIKGGPSGAINYLGNSIEAAAGTIPGDPQYGVSLPTNNFSGAFYGLTVTGAYAQYGIYLQGGENLKKKAGFVGVGSNNSVAGHHWSLPTTITAMVATFKGCNVAPVFTVVGLPAYTAPISSISWVSGVVTVTFTAPTDVSGLTSQACFVNVAGVTPSGYNGSFYGTILNFHQLQYPLVSNPGASTILGTVFFNGGNSDAPNAQEGEMYNVSDANTATWGAAATAGSGSNHVKVRFTPAAWTVVGK